MSTAHCISVVGASVSGTMGSCSLFWFCETSGEILVGTGGGSANSDGQNRFEISYRDEEIFETHLRTLGALQLHASCSPPLAPP